MISTMKRVVFSVLAAGLAAAPIYAADDRQGSGYGAYQATGTQTMEAAPGTSAVMAYQPLPPGALGGMAGPAQQMGGPLASSQAPVPGRRRQTSYYDYSAWLVGNGPYTLGRDDVMQIIVRNQPDFSGEFIVGPEGSIQYNYLGDIPVSGMTKYEVQQVIEKMLAKYIRVPSVTVTIIGYNSKAVYVVGEVYRPGKYIMRGDVIKLREAIIAAGLPTNTAALSRTHVIKPDVSNPQVRKVDLKRILYKGKLEEDIELYPGEIVVVPSTVLASVNNFLSQLLNPVTHAASAAALAAAF